MSVKVAVRVRPFNDREKQKNPKCCIKMQGPSTLITDPKTGKDRTFTFDYSFWSHDGFTEEADGLLVPSGTQYDDQEKVYNQLGKEVLDNAWDGYHCCLFAYGQTGSGKSYSMIGYGANKGIVPKAMNEVFERMKATTTKDKWYEVSVSMLEIYNECVQDLLADPDKRPSKGLNIRQSKVRGVYVQNLSQHPVPSFEAIEKIMEEGNKNRSIGSTEMNKTSSRAHTIITLSFKQFEIIDGKTTERFSNINLVDLAGSERAKSTKATKERLKEGCNINLSLTVLGQVINVLAEKSMGNKKNAVVPYRESALTRILSNALGGNSKTIMICAISPAELNYDESLNTLKYAERAKKVKNVAVVNESAQDKMIRELREENDKLKKLLMAATQGGAIDMNDPDFLARLGAFGIESKPGTNNPEEEIKEKLEDNEKEVKNMEISWKDKLEEEKKWENEREVQDKTLPHLTNLNEDPQLSGMLYYNLLESPIHVGRKTGNPKPTITIGGIGILPNHCVFEMEPKELPKEEAKEESQEEEKEPDESEGKEPDESEGNAESPETPETPSEEKVLPKFYLRPCAEEACDSIFVNGENLNEEGVLLNHNDRIIFGNNTVFLFKYPELHKQLTGEDVVSKASSLEEEKIPEEEKGDSKEIDWEFVLNEKMSKADKIRKEEQEREEKMEEHQKKVAAEKKHMEDEMKKKQEEMEDKMRELEKQMLVAEEEKRQQYEKELEDAERLMIEKIEAMEKERIEREKQQQKELEDQEVIIKERQKENETLETKLSQLMPLINEANL